MVLVSPRRVDRQGGAIARQLSLRSPTTAHDPLLCTEQGVFLCLRSPLAADRLGPPAPIFDGPPRRPSTTGFHDAHSRRNLRLS